MTGLPAIVQVARDSAGGLPIDQHADYVQNVEEGGAAFGSGFECEGISTYYDCYANTRRALGVMVRGQVPNEDTVADTTDVKVENNNPGERGLNVEVEVYYNAVMLDPIYAALMGNGSFRLTGRVVLQNEGLNLALGDVLPPQSTPVENVAGGGGTGSTGDDPYILVNLPLDGDAELPEEGQVPAGTPIDIALNLHPFESHYVCFGPSNVVPGSPFNVLGDVYLLPGSYVIPETFLPGVYTIRSVPQGNFEAGLGCEASASAVFSLEVTPSDNPVIALDDPDLGHDPHFWPDNSLIDITIAAHDPDNPGQDFPVYMDGVLLKTDTGLDCMITTSTDGFARGTEECVLPNATPPGVYDVYTTLATTTVEIKTPSIALIGGDNWPNDFYVNATLINHAPDHQYYVYYGNDTDGYRQADNFPVSTNDDGRREVTFYIPADWQGNYQIVSQDAELPSPAIDNRREIAVKSFSVSVLTDPYITVSDCGLSGTCQHRAGEVIELGLRNHSPETEYDVQFDTFSIDCSSDLGINPCTTGDTGNFYPFSYRIPISYQGTTDIVSYLNNTTEFSATREIVVESSPYIVIAGGNQHAPGERITVALYNHVANGTYDVYLDLDGDFDHEAGEMVVDDAVMDGSGAYTFTYDIPVDITPTGYDAGDPAYAAHPFASFRAGDLDRKAAEENLYVILAELVVTAIDPPANAQPGLPIPIDVTIANSAPITISGIPFDSDLYLDDTPSYDSQFPPGESKLWLNSIGPDSTQVITGFETTVYDEGTYLLHGRTDTSDYIVEGQEFNNILSTTMIISCTLDPFADNFSNGVVLSPDGQPTPTTTPPANWTWTRFGDAVLAGLLPAQETEVAQLISTPAPAATGPATGLGMASVSAQPAPQSTRTPGSGGYTVEAAVSNSVPRPFGTPVPNSISAGIIGTAPGQPAAGQSAIGLIRPIPNPVDPATGLALSITDNSSVAKDTGSGPAAVPPAKPNPEVAAQAVISTVSIPVLPNGTSNQDDDAEERSNGQMRLTNSRLRMNNSTYPYIGMLFRDIPIEQGATIQNAYIHFTAGRNDTGNGGQVLIYAERVDNATAYGNSSGELWDRNQTRTVNSVTWDMPYTWQQDQTYDSPSITDVIQEIIDRGGWNSGNDLSILVVGGAGTTQKRAYSVNASGGAYAPELVIEFEITTDQEIAVSGNGQDIVNGDLTASPGDHTDFGSVSFESGTIVRTFTIDNEGSLDLTLDGAPLVDIIGTHASDFTVSSLPATPISGGGSTTFQVTFDPAVAGNRYATVSIASDDSNEDPFTFAIQGTGTGVEMNVQSSGGVDIAAGDTTPDVADGTDFGSVLLGSGTVARSFVIENLGNADLNLSGSPFVQLSGANPGDFNVSVQPASPIAGSGSDNVVVVFNPTAAGERTATVTIGNNDTDENPYTFAVKGTAVLEPEMIIEGNGLEITSGDNTPASGDDTDFGSLNISGESLTHTFTIRNTGNRDLLLTSITLSGNTADFDVTNAPTSPVTPGGSTTFDITFDPATTGSRTVTVSIDNDDADEDPYTFDLTGVGVVAPIMVVVGNGQTVSDDSTSPLVANDTDFGNVDAWTTCSTPLPLKTGVTPTWCWMDRPWLS
jgi:phage gp45-like